MKITVIFALSAIVLNVFNFFLILYARRHRRETREYAASLKKMQDKVNNGNNQAYYGNQ